MHSTTYAPLPALTGGVSGALRRIVAGAHWLRIAYAERRRAARLQAEIAKLSEHALRDVGISREELLSYDAEARGIAEKTRLRVVDARGRQCSPGGQQPGGCPPQPPG
jgi:uncharacterized protein YjiS (DUF1127 family)